MSRRTKPSLPRKQAERMATQAWDAHSALCRTLRREPELLNNPYWTALMDAAHARFRAIYESEALK